MRTAATSPTTMSDNDYVAVAAIAAIAAIAAAAVDDKDVVDDLHLFVADDV